MRTGWSLSTCCIAMTIALASGCTSKGAKEDPKRGVAREALSITIPFSFPVEQSLFRTALYADRGLRIADGTNVRSDRGSAEVGSAAGTLEIGADALLGLVGDDGSHQVVVSAFSGGDTSFASA